jgi:hypothetical protein
MRTTLTLDDEVLRVAKAMAEARSIPLGRAVSELAIKGLRAPVASHQGRRAFPVFPVRSGARPLTLADVKKDEDEP